MQRVAEAEQRRFTCRFAEGRVDMDRVRQIVEHRPYCQRVRELPGQLGDLPPDRLDTKNALVGPV